MFVYWLGLVLGLTHFFGEIVLTRLNPLRNELISFASGVTISYIFLGLLPLLISTTASIFHNQLFFIVLFGFIVFHVIEKHIYSHARPERLFRELKQAHSIAFFIYYIALGIVLFEFSLISNSMVLLLFFPVWLNTAFGSLSFETLDEGVKGHFPLKILLSSHVLIGMVLASIFVEFLKFYDMVLAFVVGVMLYVIIKDYLPKEQKGSLTFFLSGAFLYATIIFLLQNSGFIVI